MHNIEKALSKRDDVSSPAFSAGSDGVVTFSYTEKRIVNMVHNSKMQSPDKNDVYERTTQKSGSILKDGLIRHNQDIKTDVLIKRGRNN